MQPVGSEHVVILHDPRSPTRGRAATSGEGLSSHVECQNELPPKTGATATQPGFARRAAPAGLGPGQLAPIRVRPL